MTRHQVTWRNTQKACLNKISQHAKYIIWHYFLKASSQFSRGLPCIVSILSLSKLNPVVNLSSKNNFLAQYIFLGFSKNLQIRDLWLTMDKNLKMTGGRLAFLSVDLWLSLQCSFQTFKRISKTWVAVNAIYGQFSTFIQMKQQEVMVCMDTRIQY